MVTRRLRALPRLSKNVLRSLFDRHAGACTVGLGPVGEGGAIQGVLHDLAWTRHRVKIRGWAQGSVSCGFDRRASQARATGQFEFDLPRPEKRAGIQLDFDLNGSTARLEVKPPGPAAVYLSCLRATPAIFSELWSERRHLFDFLRTGNTAVAARLRQRFGLNTGQEHACPVPSDLLGPPSELPACDAYPIVIVPVFNAFEDLDRLLRNLCHSGCPFHLILVDDGSSDPRIRPRLEAQRKSDPEHVTLIKSDDNRGFVVSVNTALAQIHRHGNGPVVLLNTDTLPPANWLPRLVAPLLHDPSIASVTPLSNNAEILSVPAHGVITDPDLEMIAAIDRVAQRFSPEHRQSNLPTGIGFCLAIGRDALAATGSLDPGFGRGYGEEVDWCQRALARGYRHVAALNLVIGHRGGASFGATAKQDLIERASMVISARYPDYDGRVREWVAADPVAAHRLVLFVAWLAQSTNGPVPVFLGHSLGGGAETALKSEIAAAFGTGAPGVIVVRVGGHRNWQIEVHCPDRVQRGEVADTALLLEILAPVAHRRVIYSCGVGAFDPASVPDLLLALAQLPTTRLELRVHDFFPISPSWNLIGSDGQYRGVPPLDTRDPAHAIPSCLGRNAVSHRDWRASWARVIVQADDITVFAPSGRDIILSAYPGCADRITLKPHGLHNLPRNLPAGGSSIGVLGGINQAKGAEVLLRLARHRGKRPAHRIVVIGEMDGAYRLPRSHVVHGRYDTAQIAHLARHYDIGLWLVPSVCPETFSFATHEALATGLPVLSFSLGAQADALRSKPNGRVISAAPDDPAAIWSEIESVLIAAQNPMAQVVP